MFLVKGDSVMRLAFIIISRILLEIVSGRQQERDLSFAEAKIAVLRTRFAPTRFTIAQASQASVS